MVRELTDEVIFNSYRKIEIHDPNAVVEKPKVTRAPRQVKEKIAIEQLDCPKCKSAQLMKGKTAVGCSNFKVCGFKIPFELLGKKLTESQLIDLIQKGKTGSIKGLSIPGKSELISGKIILDAQFNIGLE
jgi:DNA topoisomerase-3